MFGELMKWNPSQESSSWHRDIDDLFDRFFGRSQTSLAAMRLGSKHTARTMSTLFDSISQELIPKTFRSMRKVMF